MTRPVKPPGPPETTTRSRTRPAAQPSAAAPAKPSLTRPSRCSRRPTNRPPSLRSPTPPTYRGAPSTVKWQTAATFEASALEGIGSPRAAALDRSCNLYVADSAGNRIVKYNPDGQQVAAFPLVAHDPGVDGPVGVTVDAGGNLYVADRGLAVVRKLSPAGKQSAVWRACSDSTRPE